MSSLPTVRDSRDDDLPAITAIYGHHVQYGLASFEEEAPGLEDGEAPRRLSRRRISLHRRRGRGSRAGPPMSASPAAAGLSPLVENPIYIDRVARRHRLGLLPALIERCTALGFRQMIAVIMTAPTLPRSARTPSSDPARSAPSARSVSSTVAVDSVLMQRFRGRFTLPLSAQQPRCRAEDLRPPGDLGHAQVGLVERGADAETSAPASQ